MAVSVVAVVAARANAKENNFRPFKKGEITEGAVAVVALSLFFYPPIPIL
jgi:hypothetical protein